jgi:hypothetical protein
VKKFHKDRLLKLADFLEELDPKKFNLDVVVVSKKKMTPSKDYVYKPSCGTAACAMGWCPVVFPRLFKYSQDWCPNWETGNKSAFLGSILSKKSNELDDFNAVEKEFGLSTSESHYLFMPTEYPKGRKSAKCVAKRIRSFVKNDGVIS